jgi:hypothetical protein
MRAGAAPPGQIELSILRPENRLRIENFADCVVVRSARRNLSANEKSSFIRYLAAEGFIPDRYQWLGNPDAEFHSGLKWAADASCAEVRPFALRNPLRPLICVIFHASVL